VNDATKAEPDLAKVKQLLRQGRELADKQAKVVDASRRGRHLQAAIAVLHAAAEELDVPTDPASCQRAWEELQDIHVTPTKTRGNTPREVAEILVNGGLTDLKLLHGDAGLRYFSDFGLTADNRYDVIQHVEALRAGH
jgi:hypothetical protein